MEGGASALDTPQGRVLGGGGAVLGQQEEQGGGQTAQPPLCAAGLRPHVAASHPGLT